jgi:hypothetical protein
VNRRALAATVTAAALASTLTACKPAPASTSQDATAASTTGTAASPGATAAPSCTVDFGPNQAGVYATGHKVDATVSLHCNGTVSDVFVSLTLTYIPPGASPANDVEAAGVTYQQGQPAYTTSADCTPGDYALHVLYGATVGGTAITNDAWGKTASVTAADCARH